MKKRFNKKIDECDLRVYKLRSHTTVQVGITYNCRITSSEGILPIFPHNFYATNEETEGAFLVNTVESSISTTSRAMRSIVDTGQFAVPHM